MIAGTHIYGGFRISPYLAMRVFEAVDEINAKNNDPALSHTSDDDCPLCISTREKEATHDAAEPGGPRHQWTA